MSGCVYLQTAWVKVCNPILVLVGVFALEKQIIPAGNSASMNNLRQQREEGDEWSRTCGVLPCKEQRRGRQS
jgi:hypothetical protein